MKIYPVTRNFDGKQIGELRVLDNVIPEGVDYCFEIGGRVVEKEGDKITKFDLKEISLVDKNRQDKSGKLKLPRKINKGGDCYWW